MSIPAPGSPAAVRRRHRFYRHLLALTLLLLVSLVLPGGWVQLVSPGYLLLTLLLSVELGGPLAGRTQIRLGDRLYRLTGAAVFLAQLLWLLQPRHPPSSGLPLVILLSLFTIWSLARLVHWLAQETRVSRPVVLGALAGYLLLGLSGGLLLSVIESLEPGSFLSTLNEMGSLRQLTVSEGIREPLSREHTFMRINYFAFVSLTTVGYGDIIPARPLAQMLSITLSVAGPFYIAVVMGLLISRITADRSRRDEESSRPVPADPPRT